MSCSTVGLTDRLSGKDNYAKSLGLECVDKEVVSLACFGDKNPQRKGDLKSVFELELQGNRVKLIGIEHICPSMHRKKKHLGYLHTLTASALGKTINRADMFK